MTLREQQSLFMRLLGELIAWAYANGYELTGGELYRTPEQAAWYASQGKGIAHSLHTERLAVDVNVFKDGQLVDSLDGYRPLADYWKSLHSLCRWGGDFTTRLDADHFSLEWEGIQ